MKTKFFVSPSTPDLTLQREFRSLRNSGLGRENFGSSELVKIYSEDDLREIGGVLGSDFAARNSILIDNESEAMTTGKLTEPRKQFPSGLDCSNQPCYKPMVYRLEGLDLPIVFQPEIRRGSLAVRGTDVIFKFAPSMVLVSGIPGLPLNVFGIDENVDNRIELGSRNTPYRFILWNHEKRRMEFYGRIARPGFQMFKSACPLSVKLVNNSVLAEISLVDGDVWFPLLTFGGKPIDKLVDEFANSPTQTLEWMVTEIRKGMVISILPDTDPDYEPEELEYAPNPAFWVE
jgi:hypothetical protein